MAVYGYTRVSTMQQPESLEAQRRTLEGWAHMSGIILTAVFVETGVSGSVPVAGRPEGGRLWTVLQRGDVVVATKLDRLFRSALDALQTGETLRARGVGMVLLDLGGDISSNRISNLFLTIAAAFADAERNRSRERVSRVKADHPAQHSYLGRVPPFGWRVGEGGDLAVVPNQQAAIRRMIEMRAEGLSLRTIAGRMAAEGIKLSYVTVARLVD